jgi:hypothetical protein
VRSELKKRRRKRKEEAKETGWGGWVVVKIGG